MNAFTHKLKWSADIPELNIDSNFLIDFETRMVRLTYSRNFGNTKVKSARKRETGSEEKRSRIRPE